MAQYLDDNGNDIAPPASLNAKTPKDPVAPTVKELKEKAAKLRPVSPPKGYVLAGTAKPVSPKTASPSTSITPDVIPSAPKPFSAPAPDATADHKSAWAQQHPFLSKFLPDPTTPEYQQLNHHIAQDQAEQAGAEAAPGMAAVSGVGTLASGLKDIYMPTDAEKRAHGMGIEHGMSDPGTQGNPMTKEERSQANRKAIGGLAKVLAGGGQVGLVIGAPELAGLGAAAATGDAAALASLVRIGASVGIGTGASAGAGKVADKLKLSPEAKALAQQAAFWIGAGMTGMATKVDTTAHPINTISEHPVTGELRHTPQEVNAVPPVTSEIPTEPINAYHGTPAQFEGPPRTDGLGAHFTLSPELAQKFAEGSKGRVIEAKLGIKKPLRIEDHGGSHTYSGSTIDALVKQGHLPADDFDANTIAERQMARHQELLQQAGVIDHNAPTGTAPSEEWKKANYDAWGKVNNEELEKAKDYLKSKGYDGLVYDNKGEGHGDAYVAFDPEQISITNGKTAPLKPLHEMGPGEVEKEMGKAKDRDKQDVIDIFGEDGAKKWNQLQRSSNNSYDMQKADRASAELQEMESKLTPSQQNKLYGIGDTRHSLEDLKEYHDAYNALDDSSSQALGKSLKWAVSQVGDPARSPESMSPKERMRLAQLKYGYDLAVQSGYDPMQVMRSAIKSAAERFSDPNDARMMLRDVMKALHVNDEEPSPQLPAETGDPQVP